MDVQVGQVDIRALQVPGSRWLEGCAAALTLALVVYIVVTVHGLYRQSRAREPPEPLLYGQTEL